MKKRRSLMRRTSEVPVEVVVGRLSGVEVGSKGSGRGRTMRKRRRRMFEDKAVGSKWGMMRDLGWSGWEVVGYRHD